MGLKAAVRLLWPSAEHRFCARHIYANWRKKHPGKEGQRIFWSIAKSTTEADYEKNMELLDISERRDLRVPREHWCKAFFSTWSKCDIVDNNLTEAYNAAVVEARAMHVLTMFESLRVSSVIRNKQKRDKADKWHHAITPRVVEQVDDYKDKMRYCKLLFGVRGGWEVKEGDDTYVVNVAARSCTCTCRVWDLQGIPCKHVILVLSRKKKNPDDYISHWFKTTLYKELYSHEINPMTSDRFWNTRDLFPLVPPPIRKKLGRPQVKRVPEHCEGTASTKASRKGRIMRCAICRETGHKQPQCPLKNKLDNSKSAAVETNEQSGGSNKKRKARVKDSRHAEEDIIDMTRDAVPCTPRQLEPSPKKTRLFIGSTEVQFNTKIRSPRKPTKEAPNAVLEIGQPHNGQPEDVIGKKMWLERQYSRLMDDEEIHPQFRIGSKLVKKRKPIT